MKLISSLTPDFIPGLEVLAHSLSHRGNMGGVEWIIVTEDGELPGSVLKKLWVWGFIPTVLKMNEIGKDKWFEGWPDTKARLYQNYNRLRFLLLPPGEYTWLDVDLLCMRDARELVSLPSISAAFDQPQLPDDPRYNRKFNIGMMRLDASEDMFDLCVEWVKHHPEHSYVSLAEQSILNFVVQEHPEMMNWLDINWNMATNMLMKDIDKWKPDEAIFLHFMGDVKPWEGDGHWILKPAYDIWRSYREEML